MVNVAAARAALFFKFSRGRLSRWVGGRMLGRLRGHAYGGAAAGHRVAIVALTGIGLVQMLAGCVFNERTVLGIEIPAGYRATPRLPEAAPPGPRLGARVCPPR